jgi:phosphatidylglycerophosphate synthase
MADYQIIPSWMVVVMISREFLVTGLRMIALKEGKVISADMTGKLKTCLQMGVLLVGGAGWIKLFGFDIFYRPVWIVWYSIMLITTLFTIYSGVNYFIKNYKVLKNNL